MPLRPSLLCGRPVSFPSQEDGLKIHRSGIVRWIVGALSLAFGFAMFAIRRASRNHSSKGPGNRPPRPQQPTFFEAGRAERCRACETAGRTDRKRDEGRAAEGRDRDRCGERDRQGDGHTPRARRAERAGGRLRCRGSPKRKDDHSFVAALNLALASV